jgi:hypothetical protein
MVQMFRRRRRRKTRRIMTTDIWKKGAGIREWQLCWKGCSCKGEI